MATPVKSFFYVLKRSRAVRMNKKYIIALCMLIATTLTAFSVHAKVIGDDDRPNGIIHECADIGYTVARLIIPISLDSPDLATATAMKIGNSEPFFVTVAHAFYENGALKAPLDEIYAQVLTQTGNGNCVFKTSRIKSFSIGTAKPFQSFDGASRDLMVFQLVEEDFSPANITAIEYADCDSCRDDAATITAFSWEVAEGLLPHRMQCRFFKSPEVSPYNDISFRHHDCDTSAGASGALLMSKGPNGRFLPRAVHTGGWGESGREFGDGVYNISVPLDSGTINVLYNAMIRRGN